VKTHDKIEDKPLKREDIEVVDEQDSPWGVNYVLVKIQGREKILSRKIYEDIIHQLDSQHNE
jgi:hypothetical protein